MATPRKLWETNVGLRPATHIMPTFACLAITTLNQDTKSTGCSLLSPGQGHEINLGENIGDRGFCSRKLFERFIRNGALFIIRIQSNWKIEQKIGDYLATNLGKS